MARLIVNMNIIISMMTKTKHIFFEDMDIIVLVDVLSSGALVPGGEEGIDSKDLVLWEMIRRHIALAHSHVDEVRQVNTKGRSLLDFTSRKALVLIGERAGKSAAHQLAEKYGF